jgi:hypothetical protein
MFSNFYFLDWWLCCPVRIMYANLSNFTEIRGGVRNMVVYGIYVRLNYSYNNRCLFFRRLKINHESHELILESGTVTDKYTV